MPVKAPNHVARKFNPEHIHVGFTTAGSDAVAKHSALNVVKSCFSFSWEGGPQNFFEQSEAGLKLEKVENPWSEPFSPILRI